MVHQHVVVPENVEEVGGPLAERRREHGFGDRMPGLVLQIGTVHRRVQVPEPPEVQRRSGRIHVLGFQLQLAHQQLTHFVRCPRVHLQTHRERRAAALLQDGLHRLEEVLGLLSLELVVRVAREAERMVRDDVHLREEIRQMGGDDLFQGNEPLSVRQRHEALQDLRNFHACDARLLGVIPGNHDREVQRQVRDVRERMLGIHRQRSQDREDRAGEHVTKVGTVCRIERHPVEQTDAGALEADGDLVQEAP